MKGGGTYILWLHLQPCQVVVMKKRGSGKRGVLSSKESFERTHPPTLITDAHRHELSLFWGQLRVSRSLRGKKGWFDFVWQGLSSWPVGPLLIASHTAACYSCQAPVGPLACSASVPTVHKNNCFLRMDFAKKFDLIPPTQWPALDTLEIHGNTCTHCAVLLMTRG